MRIEAGFISEFLRDSKNIDPVIKNSLFRTGGLTERSVIQLIQRPTIDRVEVVSSPEDGDYLTWDVERFSKYINIGVNSIQSGQVATCLLAGGEVSYATTVPGCGTSLMALKLMQCMGTENLWVMVSPSQRDDIEKHLVGISMSGKGNIKFFDQYEMYALSPMNSIVFNGQKPRTISCGTGDAAHSLIETGVLQNFVDNGGKYVVFINMNNIASVVTPQLLGMHIDRKQDATVVVTKRCKGDSGASLLWADGEKIIVDDARLPEDYDIEKEEDVLINTGTMIMNADSLLEADGIPWRYLRTGVNVDNRLSVSYRRHNHQWLEHLTEVSYIDMPREQCYQPFKTSADLESVKHFVKNVSWSM